MKRNQCGPFYLEDDIGLLVLPHKLEGLRKGRREWVSSRGENLAGQWCGLGAPGHMVDISP